MKGDYETSKKNIGKVLPPYPNGWYIICKGKDLKNGQSREVKLSGRNIVLFRSTKGIAYALHAYCAHMGANLAIGGQVIN
jgi:cholesterol 7-dehydrogenase